MSATTTTMAHISSDVEESKLPRVELSNPSRTIYIHNHHMVGTTIQTTDLTSHLTQKYGGEGFIEDALKLAYAKCRGDSSEIKPTYTIRRNAFFSQTMEVVDHAGGADDGAVIASWKMPLLGAQMSHLTFPPRSPHSSHPITVTSFLLRLKEHFVVDSAELVWKIDRQPNVFNVQYKLVKVLADREQVVARYFRPSSSMGKGGILCIDETQIDAVVALLTCCIMIKKRAQKDLESFGVAS